jgi:hypothetical protein
MNIYKSFADFANAQFRNLNEIGQNTIVRESAIVIAGAIKQRIENFGADSDNVKIETKSPERFGAYSKAYGKKRAKKGRQTANVDLNFTGEMWRNWRPVPTSDGWGATFTSEKQLLIAGYQEEIFKTQIFAPTKTEVQLGNNAMIQRVQKILKRK